MNKIPKAKEIGSISLSDILDNKGVVLNVVKTVFPLLFLSALASSFLEVIKESDSESLDDGSGQHLGLKLLSLLLTLIATWAWAHIAIRWHRFVIMKGDKSYKGAWYFPDKTYFKFILKGLIPLGVMFCIPFLGGIVASFIGGSVGVGIVIVFVVAGIYSGLRLTFLLPAVALGYKLSVKMAWKLGKGMPLKIIWAPLRATWKYLLLIILALTVIIIIFAFAFQDFGEGATGFLLLSVASFLQAAFSTFYGILGIGVVSNYYKWLLQSRNGDNKA